MARIFTRSKSDTKAGVDSLAIQEKDLGGMIQFFCKSRIEASLLRKIYSDDNSSLSDEECSKFSRKIKLILSLRIITFNQGETEEQITKSNVPKFVISTLDKPSKEICEKLMNFLSEASTGIGCMIHSDASVGQGNFPVVE